jgi:hypothetical protein
MVRIPIRKGKGRSPEIVAVGDEEIGFIYLEKRRFVTVGEREVIDEWEIKRQQGLSVIDKLIRKVARDRSITRQEAQKLVFPQQVENTEVVPEAENILLEYPEEAQELSLLNLPANKLKAVVATEFIKGRVAYPVELVANAPINSDKLAIAPSSFYLKDGDGIKFGSCIVTVKSNHDLEAEQASVAPVSENLVNGAVGFSYSLSNKKPIIGSPDWTYDDTRQLDERLVDTIFDFYQNERAGWIEINEGDKTSGERETTSQLPSLNESTGQNSIGESSPTESLILA